MSVRGEDEKEGEWGSGGATTRGRHGDVTAMLEKTRKAFNTRTALPLAKGGKKRHRGLQYEEVDCRQHQAPHNVIGGALARPRGVRNGLNQTE